MAEGTAEEVSGESLKGTVKSLIRNKDLTLTMNGASLGFFS